MLKRAFGLFFIFLCVCTAKVQAAEGVLTILHTNDLGGRFQQIMKVGALKTQVQKDVGAVVLVDAGNAFSPFEANFTHPDGHVSPTVDMMNRAGYDAWGLGKTETHVDVNFLSASLRNAQFSVLGANLHRPQNGRFLFQVQPFAVVQTGGFRVGVLGLGMPGDGVWAGDYSLAAQYYVPLLKQRSDVVVVLSHLGYQADSTLAMRVPGINLIVGRFDGQASEASVNGVAIRQTGPLGQAVGRVDLRVDAQGVQVQNAQQIPLDIPVGSVDAMTVALSSWALPIMGEQLSVTAALGTSAGGFGASIGQTGAVGYLVADLMRSNSGADLALVSALSVDSELPQGPIRVQDVYRIYAPDHKLAVVELRGEELSRLMENGLDDLTQFFYPSGVNVVYDLTKLKGQRLVSLMDAQRRPINLRKTFKVAVESGVAQFLQNKKISSGEKVRNLVAKHIREAGVIQGRLDDRLQER